MEDYINLEPMYNVFSNKLCSLSKYIQSFFFFYKKRYIYLIKLKELENIQRLFKSASYIQRLKKLIYSAFFFFTLRLVLNFLSASPPTLLPPRILSSSSSSLVGNKRMRRGKRNERKEGEGAWGLHLVAPMADLVASRRMRQWWVHRRHIHSSLFFSLLSYLAFFFLRNTEP